MIRARARLSASLAAAILCAAVDPAAAAQIEYLLIEANEGGSSGGHAAIRFEDRTYHFQNQGGLLRLVRQDTRRLLHEYAFVGNRGVRASRVEVSEQTWRLLRERFEARRFAQEQQLALADALARERELLEGFMRRDERGRVPVPGAGYLEPAPSGQASSALLALRRRVEQEHGPDFFVKRRAALLARLQALSPDMTPEPAPDASLDTVPPPGPIFVNQYTELASTLTALELVEHGARLSAGTHRSVDDPALRLEPDERRALGRASQALDERLLQLTTMQPLGTGYALLVGLARRVAIEASLRADQLVFLDAFAENARAIQPESGLLAPRLIDPWLIQARDDLVRARRSLVRAAAPGERELAALEETANRYEELARSRREGDALRVQPGRLAPTRPALRPATRPALDDDRLMVAIERAQAREVAVRRALKRTHGYHLVSHNCVSAIFDTLHSAFEDPRAESSRRLGGYVDPAGPLRFWPLVSAAVVRDRYRVSEEWRIPSFRAAELAEMRARERGLVVALRESNTLTSRAYTKSPGDSLFLFFTDSAAALPARPLLGAFNLGAGLAETGWGVVWAPFDEGRRLVSGLRGVLMSAPELAFFNIRKGSSSFVGLEHRALIEAALGS